MKTRLSCRKPSSFIIALIIASVTGSVGAEVVPYQGSNEVSTEKIILSKFKEDPAITRTRQQVMMLDDLYKTAVVLITEHYVTDPSILSAATASKALFAAMKKNGWHDARLLGFTDVLFNADENSPQDTFEKQAKKSLLAGKTTHETVVKKNGKRFLRVATSVPVVMEKCIMCHANFKGKKGPIGSISYIVPMIE